MSIDPLRACTASYRRGVTAWERLEAMLFGFHQASADAPRLFVAQRRLEQAAGGLDLIGEALALLPGLVDEVREEKRIGRLLRRQALERGLVLQPDGEPSVQEGEPIHGLPTGPDRS